MAYLVFAICIGVTATCIWGMATGRQWTAIMICAVLVGILTMNAAYAKPVLRHFPVLVHMETGAFGYMDILNYSSDAECQKKIEFIRPQFEEFNTNNNDEWTIRCATAFVNGEDT